MTYGFSGIWWIASIVFAVYCYMDWQKHTEASFEAAGTPKQTALIIIIVGGVCCLLGSLYYYFGIKPKVDAVDGGGAPPAA